MKVFASILVPLDGSKAAAKSLGSAVWIAAQLKAKLHILNATERPLPAREALVKLRIPEEYWSRITLHQAPTGPETDPEQVILNAARGFDIDLLVMAACGETVDRQAKPELLTETGHVARTILEHCEAPVLLIPPAYVEQLPWRSILVPVSGETEVDEVLNLAVRLARALKIGVQIAHVVDEGRYGYTTEVQYADSPYHEYAGRLQELINRAALQCSPTECHWIVEDVYLCRGDIVEEVLELIHRKHIGLLAVGWHGKFLQGHARVLKAFLEQVSCPLLLVKSPPPPPFELKVGEAIE
jgi:nucleotide-binding universal stress UspA family protein